MKTAIKLFALMLALLMLVPCFAACGNTDDGKSDDGGDVTTTDDNGEDTSDSGDETSDSPYIYDMDGYNFKAYAWMDAHGKEEGDIIYSIFYAIDFYYDNINESRDPITVATWTRNQEIEASYNCFITPTKATTTHTTELTNLWSSQQKYDLAVILDSHAATCATMNLLTNLTDKEHIKLNEPYFDQNSVDQLSMAGKLYYLSGDMNTSTLDNTCVTIVNDKLYNDSLAQRGEKSIYDKVKDGEWTMAEMMRLALKANVDAGEDGAYSVEGGDIWGYLVYCNSDIYHFYACGGRITENDEDGYPTMVIDSDKSIKAINTLMETIHISKLPKGIKEADSPERNPWFTTGQVLFTDTIMWDIRTYFYRNIETWKYGILPMALVDNGQYDPSNKASLGYLTSVQYGNGTCALWCMPSFYDDVTNASILFNAFAEFSSKPGSTMEAFYTKTISLQAAKDENSRQMVDIIKNSMTYDIAGCYDREWGGFEVLIDTLTLTNSNPVNSITPAKVAQATMNMEFTLEAFKFPSDPVVQ